MRKLRGFAIVPAVALLLAACQTGGAGSPSEAASAPASVPASQPAESMAATGPVCEGETDGMLARVCDAGVIRVSTDPAYPPQSYLDTETEEFLGFDIDVAAEIADRLGVDIEWQTPDWDAITAGSWSDRWDMSVGSMTITEDRKAVIDFTQPYYYTPAQMATFTDSGITSLEDLAGETVCVGRGTTYLSWLDGTLTLTAEAGDVTDPPEGVESTTLKTDVNCADAWRSGRTEAAGWLSSSTTVAGTIAAGYEVVTIGDPVFFEPLAVAFDNKVEDNDSLVAAVDQIIGEMHEDGTLSELSLYWFCDDGSYPCENSEEHGLDLTTQD